MEVCNEKFETVLDLLFCLLLEICKFFNNVPIKLFDCRRQHPFWQSILQEPLLVALCHWKRGENKKRCSVKLCEDKLSYS